MVTTLRRPVVKQCPYRDETDIGLLVIVIPGEAPELHNLGHAIDEVAAAPGGISHEEFTARVAEMLPPGSKVTTTWRTGVWDEVEVTEDAPGWPEQSAA